MTPNFWENALTAKKKPAYTINTIWITNKRKPISQYLYAHLKIFYRVLLPFWYSKFRYIFFSSLWHILLKNSILTSLKKIKLIIVIFKSIRWRRLSLTVKDNWIVWKYCTISQPHPGPMAAKELLEDLHKGLSHPLYI